jgi:hypothetical protein
MSTKKNIHNILSTNNCTFLEKALLLHAATNHGNKINAPMTMTKVSIAPSYNTLLNRPMVALITTQ